MMHPRIWHGTVPALLLWAVACAPTASVRAPAPRPVLDPPSPVTAVSAPRPVRLSHAIIPMPTALEIDPTAAFIVDSTTVVEVDAASSPEVKGVARYLVRLLAPTAVPALREVDGNTSQPLRSIRLVIDSRSAGLGAEGYEVTVTSAMVTVRAPRAVGLFYGIQTIRQLLPVSVEHPAAMRRSLRIAASHITDTPRFAWRGAMLDVSRHFLGPDAVRRYIDAMALYKLNRLHLHLADDQGWRIEILSRPNLTRHGGSTQVGGGAGGFYTQREYTDLVAYAASRFITVVPEIDMPGHTNAALASYPSLNCDGVAPPLYTGIRVGFSSLCVERDSTYAFVDDVVRELAGLTPGAYFHIGGDEVERLTATQYRHFVERVQTIVNRHGKRMIGWGEIAPAALLPSTIVQHWKSDSSALHAARGGSVILSPAKHVYLDMKYDSSTALGLRWAGLVDVRGAYEWDPATYIPGMPVAAILGVEAPLWSETLVTESDFQYLAFPRLLAVAETGWSTAGARDWTGFSARLGAHGPRLRALGINFFPSTQIPWIP